MRVLYKVGLVFVYIVVVFFSMSAIGKMMQNTGTMSQIIAVIGISLFIVLLIMAFAYFVIQQIFEQ